MAVSLWPDEDQQLYPPLPAVGTAYTAKPLLPVLHPPIELAGVRPSSRLDRYGWIDFPSICLGTLL
jgi:hypothetical protein